MQVNSLEEASYIISNLRKLSSSNQRQNNSCAEGEKGQRLLQSVSHFDRVVKNSCEEMQREVERGKRIDQQICANTAFGPRQQEEAKYDSSTAHSSTIASVVVHEGERSSEDFRAALVQR